MAKKKTQSAKTGRQKSPPRRKKPVKIENGERFDDDDSLIAPTMPDLPADPRAMERTMFELARLLEGQHFESEADVEHFMKQIEKKGDRDSLLERRELSSLQRAQELIYQAHEARTEKKRIELAKKALAVSADCADAYIILAEYQRNPKEARKYYEAAVAAGERAIGEDDFKEYEGQFWGFIETRPYMRAREGLASVLWFLGERQQAIDHYRDMLRLNPGDNQGIRYMLLRCLLIVGDNDEAEKLLEQFSDDGMAEWLYSRAFLTFRQKGATPAAEVHLLAAFEQNPFVPEYLLGRQRMPRTLPPFMGWGDQAEAQHYAVDAGRIWLTDPAALAWFKQIFDSLPPGTLKPRLMRQ